MVLFCADQQKNERVLALSLVLKKYFNSVYGYGDKPKVDNPELYDRFAGAAVRRSFLGPEDITTWFDLKPADKRSVK